MANQAFSALLCSLLKKETPPASECQLKPLCVYLNHVIEGQNFSVIVTDLKLDFREVFKCIRRGKTDGSRSMLLDFRVRLLGWHW